MLGLLLTVAFLTGIAAAFLGGGAWELHLAADAALAVYVAVLLDAKKRRAERRVKVRSIRRRGAEPEYVRFYGRVGAAGRNG